MYVLADDQSMEIVDEVVVKSSTNTGQHTVNLLYRH